jgi:hypothetical protein
VALKKQSASADRFARIQRDTALGYAITFKDLIWLVRLVETLDRGGSLKKTVNFFFVEVADPSSPHGKKWGVECDVCGERFFDRISQGKNPRLLASGIPVAIEHAKVAHQSTGGRVGSKERIAKTSGLSSASSN